MKYNTYFRIYATQFLQTLVENSNSLSISPQQCLGQKLKIQCDTSSATNSPIDILIASLLPIYL